MKRITKVVCALCLGMALTIAAVPVAPALAKKPASTQKLGNQALRDCYNLGRLTRHYTKAELNHALAVMPAYVQEYSSCQSILQNALASGSVRSNGTGGGGGSSISTPVIIVIVVVVLAIVTFGGLLIRRRRGLTGAAPAGDQPTQVIEPETRATDDRHDRGDGGPAP